MNWLLQVPAGMSLPALLLCKMTALLGAGWLGHLALAGCHPQWRKSLWRLVMVGLLVLPIAEVFAPKISVPLAVPSGAGVAMFNATRDLTSRPLPITNDAISVDNPAASRPASAQPAPSILARAQRHGVMLFTSLWGLIVCGLMARQSMTFRRLSRVLAASSATFTWCAASTAFNRPWSLLGIATASMRFLFTRIRLRSMTAPAAAAARSAGF
jgi:hypothetical protein